MRPLPARCRIPRSDSADVAARVNGSWRPGAAVGAFADHGASIAALLGRGGPAVARPAAPVGVGTWRTTFVDPGRSIPIEVQELTSIREADVVLFMMDVRAGITPDDFAAHWMATQTALYGDSVTLTEGYRQWWSYIPHFVHTPGYVYAYAFGELLVLALYARYQEEGAAFTRKISPRVRKTKVYEHLRHPQSYRPRVQHRNRKFCRHEVTHLMHRG